MQVRKYRMVNEIRGYQTPDGVCVDFADVIQALDLPIRLDKKSRRATGWIFAENQQIVVERDANTVQIMNKSRPLQPGELVDTPEGWCVDTDALAGWFGVSLTANLRDSEPGARQRAAAALHGGDRAQESRRTTSARPRARSLGLPAGAPALRDVAHALGRRGRAG